MLMRFACVDTSRGPEVHFHRRDIAVSPIVLRASETFYGVPFGMFKAKGHGDAHVDDETFACEILRPGDPRLSLEDA